MAGHSQFKNIMHRKGAQDKKRAKIFSKIRRELTVAAQMGGEDPEANPRLRTAIVTARGANMPKDTMERAIKQGSGAGDASQYAEMRYEGYGPAGVAFLVEVLTDNRNRSAAEIRALFNRHGGSMGETGSVSFLFEQSGIVLYPDTVPEEKLLSSALASGAEDMESQDGAFHIKVSRSSWAAMCEALEADFGKPLHAEVGWFPLSKIEVSEDKKESIQKMVQAFEDNEDVQQVWQNAF